MLIYIINVLLRLMLASSTSVHSANTVDILASVDGTGECKENVTQTLIQNIIRLTRGSVTLHGGICVNTTTGELTAYCSGDHRPVHSVRIKLLLFQTTKQSLTCDDYTHLEKSLRADKIDASLQRRVPIQDAAGLICGVPVCPPGFEDCIGCLWGIPKSKKQDGSPTNSAALGGGLGGGLALLSLLAAAAVVYRKWRKPKVDDVNNRSNEDTDFAGTTPIAPFGEAPSSVPPAGTT